MALVAAAAVLAVGGVPAYAGPVVPVSGNYYYLVAAPVPSVHMCLDVYDAYSDPGTRLQLWDCGPQWNQQFKFEHLQAGGQNVWRMRLRYASSMCVAVYQGPLGSPSQNAPMVIEPCSNGWEQLFLLGTSADGDMFIPLYQGGMCMGHYSDYYYPTDDRGWTVTDLSCAYPYDSGIRFEIHWQVWNTTP